MNGSVPEIAISIIGIIVSIIVARFFGDKAGTDAVIRYEEQKKERERIAALQTILNQVNLIGEIAKTNASQNSYVLHFPAFVRLPTQVLEVAFVSERPALSHQYELLGVVNEYLSTAYTINSQIDFLTRIEMTPVSENSREPQKIFERVIHDSKALTATIDELKKYLEVELQP